MLSIITLALVLTCIAMPFVQYGCVIVLLKKRPVLSILECKYEKNIYLFPQISNFLWYMFYENDITVWCIAVYWILKLQRVIMDSLNGIVRINFHFNTFSQIWCYVYTKLFSLWQKCRRVHFTFVIHNISRQVETWFFKSWWKQDWKKVGVHKTETVA